MSQEIEKVFEGGFELQPVEASDSSILALAKRIPLADIAALGTAFLALPKKVRAAAGAAETLYRAVPQKGALGLKAARKGSDLVVGSWKMANGKSKFAQFIPVEGKAAVVNLDPGVLLAAVAIAEINYKLDALHETQEEIYNYIRQKDDAERQGNLQTLIDIVDDYRLNWDNNTFKNSRNNLVLSIRKEAEQDILLQKKQIASKLEKKGIFSLNADAEKKVGEVLGLLKDYQTAVYIYSFSSFLEVVLAENYKREHLESTVRKVEEHSLDYREVYTLAYNQIEALGGSTVQQQLLGGLSAVGNKVGKAIEQTPIGDKTRIDETLIGAGKVFSRTKSDQVDSLMSKMPSVKMVDVRPFVDCITGLGELYSGKVEMLTDGESVYLLPEA